MKTCKILLLSLQMTFFSQFPTFHFSFFPRFSIFPFFSFHFSQCSKLFLFPISHFLYSFHFLWVSWSPANAMSCYVMICSHILLERYSVVVNRWGGEGNKQQMHGGLGTLQLKMHLAVRRAHCRSDTQDTHGLHLTSTITDQTLLLRKTHTQQLAVAVHTWVCWELLLTHCCLLLLLV